MDQVLQDCPDTECYLDDIIITEETNEVHLQSPKIQRLADNDS